MNDIKKTIGWADKSWNPVVGCENNCYYCYGKRMNDRFKWIKKWSEPRFFRKRLKEPFRLKKPSKIFVCSMADLFGDWIPVNVISEVISVAVHNPRHTFMFLTKNPTRYLEFDFPKNCWLGTTIEMVEYGNRMKPFTIIKNNKFVSIEPLLGDFTEMNFDRFDLVIVGAMTGPGAVKPRREWIKSIKHRNIFLKDNIKKFLNK